MGKNKSSSGGNKVQPFALFCSEQKQTRAEFRNLGMPQLFSDKRISDMWTSLSVVDKQRYVQMAKEFNNQSYAANAPVDTNVQGRFDSFGRSMLAKQQEDALAKCKLDFTYFTLGCSNVINKSYFFR